ncbi:hypothetical protein D3C75_716730 [compost metagenome]
MRSLWLWKIHGSASDLCKTCRIKCQLGSCDSSCIRSSQIRKGNDTRYCRQRHIPRQHPGSSVLLRHSNNRTVVANIHIPKLIQQRYHWLLREAAAVSLRRTYARSELHCRCATCDRCNVQPCCCWRGYACLAEHNRLRASFVQLQVHLCYTLNEINVDLAR